MPLPLITKLVCLQEQKPEMHQIPIKEVEMKDHKLSRSLYMSFVLENQL